MAVLPSLHVGSATTLARHIGHVRSRSNQRDMQSSQNMCCLGRNKNWQIQIKRADIKEPKLVWVGKLECISIEKKINQSYLTDKSGTGKISWGVNVNLK